MNLELSLEKNPFILYVARLCNRFLLFLFHFPICQVIRAKTFLVFFKVISK